MQPKNSVLIVDDSRENIDGLRSILDAKYTVYVALNGEMALKIIDTVKPDIVLLDVNMPGISGFEVLEKMKRDVYLPVIFITSETDAFNEARGLMMGAVDYITKPYNPDIVSVKVKNHIENKMYRDNLEKLVETRTKELTSFRDAIIMGMSLLAEGRDKGTGEHIKRIQKYTAMLGVQVYKSNPGFISVNQISNIILLSPLHDIGKVFIPDAILLKKGKLTNEEFEIIKGHTTYGGDVLRKTQNMMHDASDLLNYAVEIAEGHHEKYDGTGYPYGLSGDTIPISARIVALADVYDALTSIREYKAAYTHEEAAEIILQGDGRTMPSHFDPRVLNAFKVLQKDFSDIRANAHRDE